MSLSDLLLENFLLPESIVPSDEKCSSCIIATSFGRNSVPDENLHHVREEWEKYKQDISMFSFLKSQVKFNEGEPNRNLAEWCFEKWLAHDGKIPIYGQWEVMYALYWNHQGWYEKNHKSLVAIWPNRNSRRFSTYDFVEAVRNHHVLTRTYGYAGNIVNPILIAHPQMLSRFRFIVNRLLYVTAAPSDVDVKMRVAWK